MKKYLAALLAVLGIMVSISTASAEISVQNTPIIYQINVAGCDFGKLITELDLRVVMKNYLNVVSADRLYDIESPYLDNGYIGKIQLKDCKLYSAEMRAIRYFDDNNNSESYTFKFIPEDYFFELSIGISPEGHKSTVKLRIQITFEVPRGLEGKIFQEGLISFEGRLLILAKSKDGYLFAKSPEDFDSLVIVIR